MKFFTRYNPPGDEGISFENEKSMTVQSEADACDINLIMERFNRTGTLPVKYEQPIFGDARIPDFQTAKQLLIDAENQFYALPAKTREHFHNSVEIFNKVLEKQLKEGIDDKTAKEYFDMGIILSRQESPEQKLDGIRSATIELNETIKKSQKAEK